MNILWVTFYSRRLFVQPRPLQNWMYKRHINICDRKLWIGAQSQDLKNMSEMSHAVLSRALNTIACYWIFSTKCSCPPVVITHGLKCTAFGRTRRDICGHQWTVPMTPPPQKKKYCRIPILVETMAWRKDGLLPIIFSVIPTRICVPWNF